MAYRTWKRDDECIAIEKNIIAQGAVTEFSPALKAAVGLGRVIALFAAIKIGRIMIRLRFGLIGLALLGGTVCRFLLRH